MFDVLAPRIGIAELGGSGHGAMLLSVTAATAGLTTLALSRWPTSVAPDGLLALSMMITTAGFAVTAAPSAVTVVTGAAIIGIGDGPALVQLMGIRYRDTPSRLSSQIFTTGASLKISAASIGAALAGVLVGRPLYELLLLGGATQLGAAALLVRSMASAPVPATT
ncbi:MFS transporter [Leekyejoonella antrihumi]|uniref:MFS transporter n=1 Tax=Leekyejoonella antrihumi TaxID=1660198 RepID=A0A563DVU3_9MICO|nr:MFS transporter [Leekyejoonella antrihumi]TWP34390.1 MFS transporter [Leekyejoonella antrihumi]